MNWRAMFAVVSIASAAAAQDVKPFEPSEETLYFDFWPGTWARVVDGKVDRSATSFTVVRSVNPASYVETWRMPIDARTTLDAVALRAWDKTNRRWMYTWVSSNGLFQVWEGRKVGNDWYIYKFFDVAGDKYLSRQVWLPQGDGKLTRISEKSYDDGKTWQLRFKETYQRVD